MSLSTNEYQAKFINTILFSASQEEVKLFIDTAMNEMEEKKEKVPAIIQFAETIVSQLDLFNPLNKDAQQWSNIKTARIQLFRVKRNLESVVA